MGPPRELQVPSRPLILAESKTGTQERSHAKALLWMLPCLLLTRWDLSAPGPRPPPQLGPLSARAPPTLPGLTWAAVPGTPPVSTEPPQARAQDPRLSPRAPPTTRDHSSPRPVPGPALLTSPGALKSAAASPSSAERHPVSCFWPRAARSGGEGAPRRERSRRRALPGQRARGATDGLEANSKAESAAVVGGRTAREARQARPEETPPPPPPPRSGFI
nr:uncharacterized protein LOC127488109 [Oryctolagus cuniculus]